jgi:choline dehydrogenase-like flavoprotein
MLDAGRSLDSARRVVVARLAAAEPAQWNPADVRHLKEGVEASANGIPLKRLYGSDFPFHTSLTIEYSNAGARPSYALGGLSTVWGAGMLPFHPDDITDWPISPSDLEAGYRSVLAFMPCSGAHDDVEELFPLYSDSPLPLRPARQGEAFLRDTARARDALRKNGIVIGRSRLAVDGSSCRRCGLCLYGCPYGLIYNSESTLQGLLELPNLQYEPGFVVDRLHEEGTSVHVEGHDLPTGAPRVFDAGRVMLAAGAISSTAILLASLNEYDEPIRLLDSFYFLTPLLRFQGVSGLENETLHTLSQAFILVRDPNVCPEFIHFSLYGYNDLMIPSLKATAGAVGGLSAIFSRAMVCGGYLHSRHSPGIQLTLRRDGILLEGENSAAAITMAKNAARKLLSQAARLRAIPLIPAMRFPAPGRGFHTGGSFPMRSERAPHTSDPEGRPFGFERVHIVDATCFTSIPATTITLPVMANAWRIANLAGDRA